MTRVLPLPAPARMSTGPSTASTASRCCGLSWDKYEGNVQATRNEIIHHGGTESMEGFCIKTSCPPCLSGETDLIGMYADRDDRHQFGLPPTAGASMARRALHSWQGQCSRRYCQEIDAMLVAVVPGEADGVLANGLYLGRPRRRLEHRQRPAIGLMGSPGWRPSFSRSSLHSAQGQASRRRESCRRWRARPSTRSPCRFRW